MKEIQYSIDLKITIQYLMPPNNLSEKVKREELQIHINRLADRWITNKENQKNLIKSILWNQI
jgi:hypothetical protein